jgi:hypothetical protein
VGVPEPGRPLVAALCERLLAKMDVIAPSVTTRIRDEVDGYGTVHFDEHVGNVREQQSRMLRAIAAGRGPDAEDLERAQLLGRRRATQGVPAHAVIGAYHVGNRELWDVLQSVAGEGDGAAVAALPGVAALMWVSVHATSSALAAAHSDVTRTLHTEQVTLRHRLVELVLSGSADGDEGHDVAAALGFAAAGGFTAACLSAPGEAGLDVDWVQRRLDRGRGAALVARHREVVAVLVQRTPAPELAAALRDGPHGLRLGVGLERQGLAGAAASMADARRALASTTESHPVSLFERDWLAAVLLDAREQLRPLLAGALPVAAANSHLGDAVRAYADQGFSVSAAALQLGVHPNTAAYRLERWKELSGWDARRLEELVLSLLATWMAERE